MTTDPATRERLLRAFTQQRLWCEESSPFMAELMACTADWLRGVAPENGPMGPAAMGAASACGALAGISNDPLAAAVPLRWAAGLHGLALAGLQPWASLWPSTRGATTPAPGRASLFAAIEHAWATQRSAVLLALRHAPQTNEVMRSAVLLPGLLQAQARHPDLPITLLELGSSAGLNLLLDRWRYEWHGQWPLEPAAASNPHGQAGPLVATWGLENAGLTLRSTWRGALGNTERDRPWTRALGSRPPVVRRLGCDVQPLLLAGRPGAAGCADAADTVGAADCRALGQVEADAVALRLQSFVWADQHDRLERLRQAIGFARSAHCPEFEVRQQSALSFVQQELAALPRTTVVARA